MNKPNKDESTMTTSVSTAPRISLRTHSLIGLSLLYVLLAGCATTSIYEDKRTVAGKTAVMAGSALTGGLSPDICNDAAPGDAREACLARVREVNGMEPRAKFDDLETYRAKRDSKAEKGE
jgi:hypothetical protein